MAVIIIYNLKGANEGKERERCYEMKNENATTTWDGLISKERDVCKERPGRRESVDAMSVSVWGLRVYLQIDRGGFGVSDRVLTCGAGGD